MLIKHRSWAAFTLLEVMVTTAVLALGAVLIYEAFFLSLDIHNYCQNYLSLASFADEKIWEAQDTLSTLGPQASVPGHGELLLGQRVFTWDLSSQGVAGDNLYETDLVIQWKEGRRTEKFFRNAYALYRPPQQT